jgi:hypothetical protein
MQSSDCLFRKKEHDDYGRQIVNSPKPPKEIRKKTHEQSSRHQKASGRLSCVNLDREAICPLPNPALLKPENRHYYERTKGYQNTKNRRLRLNTAEVSIGCAQCDYRNKKEKQ